ncbi:DNA polymerase I [Olsenella sp. Marseille-QA0557]|uniref:DNA polymerase I n=1 Tax=Olsenella sp. Marseille-QA0557 TaxID=3378782 RepID=UPI003D152D40
MEQQKTLAVIDGNSLMHRAFHAIRQPMSAPDGRSTNALFGFFNMFVKFIETFTPDGILCAFDKGKPRIRMELLPQYKAQRPPMDPSLAEQFPMVKELLHVLNIPVVELEGWEGDDILGTLARRGEQVGYNMLLVTGDRDMYQLSTDKVQIVSTKKGVSDVVVMTPESVVDLYGGITPQLVPDFYGLKGDTSDNIPGVPGIGPKKAAALITQYGNLDEVLAHADEVKGKMGQNLREHAEDALLSRKIATIRTDAPLEIDLTKVHFPDFDPTAVVEAFSALGFTGMTQRLVRLSDEPVVQASKTPTLPSSELKLYEGDADEFVSEAIKAGEWIGVAASQADSSGQLTFALGDTPRIAVWLSSSAGLVCFDNEKAYASLARLFKEGLVCAGDVKGLVHLLCPMDSSRPAELAASEIAPERIFDAGIAAYLLESDRTSYELPGLVETYLSITLPDPSDDIPQEALDAISARHLHPVLEKRLEEDGSSDVMHKIEMPLLPVLVAMERRGLSVDTHVLAQQSSELGAEIDEMAHAIHEAAGEEFNIDSPMQLSHVLFDVLGLPTRGLKRTRRGYYSTNAKVLADLASQSKIVSEVLEYRERAKIKSTYLDALPALVLGDGRIHTTFNQTVAATGRLSSSDPNLQNIPTRSELGHRVRKAFNVAEGSVFLACDYSQIELRLLAHLSGDEHLIAAFCEGADFHASTAARVFNVPVEEVTPLLRSRAKAVNFGIVYGQQAFGLASSLKIPRAEAQEMIDRYFEAYPGVDAYLKEQVAFAHAHGYVTTMYGRRRHTKDINSRNFQARSFAERTAMNHPMQGTAADIIKIAMARVEKRIAEEGFKSRLILQIHDELDLEVPENEIEAISELVQTTMQGVVELKVPLLAEVSWGQTWAEAK